MAISDRTISKIKELTISEVLAAESISLKKIGREFVTHCCWHSDKNPSLTISDDKGFLFCHVCREGGDVIAFFMKKYGLSFRDACERIASSHNIQVEYKEEDVEAIRKKKEEQEAAFEKADMMHHRFRKSLQESNFPVDYLKSRNIKGDTSKFFELGYDKRENRLVVPIKNKNGRIVGFSGRSLGNEMPKYKNTANNSIFIKSELVFNESGASEHIREKDQCIFVEGHFDAISMWQYGFKNTVALQGTASPSENVLARLQRKTKQFVLCMDADAGGVKAISLFLNAVQQKALRGEIDIKIATLTFGKDPDEAIKNGVDMNEIISSAVPWLDWILDQWLESLDFSNQSKVQEIEKKIKSLIGQLSSTALRTHYFDKCAIRLAQNKQSVAAQILKNFISSSHIASKANVWKRPDWGWTRYQVEKRLLRLYIHQTDLRDLLRPIMSFLLVPEMVWLWQRITELEEYTEMGCSVDSLMSVLCVSEANYMKKLRPIMVPTISLKSTMPVLLHIEDIMYADALGDGHTMLNLQKDDLN